MSPAAEKAYVVSVYNITGKKVRYPGVFFLPILRAPMTDPSKTS